MSEWRQLQMRDLMLEFHDGPHATPAPSQEGPVYLGIKNITVAGLLNLPDVRHIAEDASLTGRDESSPRLETSSLPTRQRFIAMPSSRMGSEAASGADWP